MWRMVLSLVLYGVVISGCSRKGPPELTLEEVPEALKTAFASARTALRTNAEGIAKLVGEGQYVAASLQLQALAGTPDLNDEQRRVLAGATIAVNSKLQEMAATTDPAVEAAAPGAPASQAAPIAKEEAAAAAAALEYHIRNK